MNIIDKRITDIRPYEKNPRNNAAAVNAVEASIRQFGWKVPIVIDRHNVIVAGHTRYLAAKKIGYDTVPCVVADDLTPVQVRAYRLADNRVSELATWDFDSLSAELEALTDFDMGDFGFDMPQIGGDIATRDGYPDSKPDDLGPYRPGPQKTMGGGEVIAYCGGQNGGGSGERGKSGYMTAGRTQKSVRRLSARYSRPNGW